MRLQERDRLQELPPELLIKILTQFDSLKGLYSAIKSSPILFRVFNANRIQILSCWIQRHFSPKAIYEATAILKAPTATDPENSQQLGALWEFIDDYFQQSGSVPSLPTDSGKLVEFVRLFSRIKWFTDEYFSRTMERLLKSGTNIKNGPEVYECDLEPKFVCTNACPGLSDNERARLHRGFLRYELYSRCFAVSKFFSYHTGIEGSQQFERFLSRLNPSEVEEMTCIYQYIFTYAGSIVHKMNNEILRISWHSAEGYSRVKMLDRINARCHRRPAPTLANVIQDSADPALRNHLFLRGDGEELVNAGRMIMLSDQHIPHCQHVGRYSLGLFNSMSYSSSFAGGPAKLGVESLRRLFSAEMEIKYFSVRRPDYLDQDFLPEALDQNPSVEEFVPGWSDGDLTPIMTYRKFPLPGHEYAEFDIYWHLRRLGYVFWDTSRLKDEFMQGKMRDAATWTMEAQESSEMGGDCDTQSILSDVMVPKYVMSYIFRTYGEYYEPCGDLSELCIS